MGHYERAVAERPELVWPRYRAAASGRRIALYESAAGHLRAAILRRPKNPALHTQLAAMLLHFNRPEEAAEACDRALALDPDFAEAYRNRALIDDRLARADLRRDDGRRFAMLSRFLGPAQAEQLGLHSFLYTMLGRGRGGAAGRDGLLGDALAANPSDTDLRVIEANRLGRSGRPAEAVAVLDGVLRDQPGHLLARYNRAVYLRLLKRPEALAEYRASVDDPRFEELYREQPRAIVSFAVIANDLIERGRADEAVTFAERGLAESERTGLYAAEAHYALARALVASAGADRHRLDRARERLRTAVGLRSDLVGSYAKDWLFADLRRADPSFLNPPASGVASH